MRHLFASLLALSLLISGCSDKQEEQRRVVAQAQDEAKRQAEQDAKDSIGRRVTAACSTAVEKFLAPNAQVLDWITLKDSQTGEPQNYRFYNKTSTGYSQELRATVSGRTDFLSALCYTNQSFEVIDMKYTWMR